MSILISIELHEDEIPDLHISAAVAWEYAVQVAELARVRTDVIVDFRTRSAWTGFAHLPEVVLLIQTDNAFSRHTRARRPNLCRRIIFAEHCYPELIDRKLEFLCKQSPGVVDGFLLEVRAEGEIPQHLEECLVAPCVAHIIQVIVLTTRADALLCACSRLIRPLLASKKYIFELVHAGVHKQKCRVLGWN